MPYRERRDNVRIIYMLALSEPEKYVWLKKVGKTRVAGMNIGKDRGEVLFYETDDFPTASGVKGGGKSELVIINKIVPIALLIEFSQLVHRVGGVLDVGYAQIGPRGRSLKTDVFDSMLSEELKGGLIGTALSP